MYKAIQVSCFGGPGVLKTISKSNIEALSNVQLGSSPSKILVDIKYSGVNPVDTYIRAGAYGALPDLPYTPGKDGAGVVKKIGPDVKNFKVGDRVFVCHQGQYGTLSKYAFVEEKNVFHLGEKLSFAEGAALGVPYLTAYRALYILGKGEAGKRVLIHGATGGVGQAAVKLAVNGGMEVVGTAGSEEGLECVKSLGATSVYNHRQKGYIEKMTAEENHSFDIIIEMLSNVNLGHDLSLTRERGIVVVVGCRGEVTINPRLMMKPETCIVGCALMSSSEREWSEAGKAIENAAVNGSIKPKIHKTFELEEASAAHEFIMNGEPALGNVVVRVPEVEE